MERPIIMTLDGKEHAFTKANGRIYRIAAEFNKNQPTYGEADYIEKHAEFISQVYDDLTVEEVLNLPLEEILPASIEASKFVFDKVWAKVQIIGKNSEKDKAQ